MDDGKKSFLEKIMPNMKTCNGISICFSLSCSFVTIKSVKSVISIYSGTNLFCNSERFKTSCIHNFLTSCSIVTIVPSYHSAIVPSWVQNFFSLVFCGSDTFSLGYFVAPRFFLVGIS